MEKYKALLESEDKGEKCPNAFEFHFLAVLRKSRFWHCQNRDLFWLSR